VAKHRPQTAEHTTEASAENRDAQGRPLPKLPRVPDIQRKSGPRLAWERIVSRGREHASAVSISSLLRFRRLKLTVPVSTAIREPVHQLRGLSPLIQMAGLLVWFGLWWVYDLTGALIGAPIALLCYLIGWSRSKPWRCGNCKSPLATAKVRVCPRCDARLVDVEPLKVMPRKRRS
jgi:hypothetical protein